MLEKTTEDFVAIPDRLTAVCVKGLFGIFDHNIPLNVNSRVTIVHGSNGVGKTIVLQMIRALLTGSSEILLRVPYEDFSLTFQSGDSIKVTPVEATEGVSKSLQYSVVLGGRTYGVSAFGEPDTAVIRQAARHFDDSWKYLGSSQWRDDRDGEVATTEELCNRHDVPDSLRAKLARPLDPLLEKISRKCRVRLIGTDRLMSHSVDRSVSAELKGEDPNLQGASRLGSSIQMMISRTMLSRSHEQKSSRTIEVYARELHRRVRQVLTDYGLLTERLDRSLVQRLVTGQAAKTPEELVALFEQIGAKRRLLTELGLLTVAEDLVQKDATGSEILHLVSNSTPVFSLYVHDMQQKLALFDEIQSKLEILRGRTDQRFQFKKLKIDSERGFYFKSDSGSEVAAADLSSGEQHEMILLYELLFLAKEGDLVLIDEPEISLHVEWQMEFLEDLREILRASNIDVLMATHSAAIARGANDELVSLGARRA